MKWSAEILYSYLENIRNVLTFKSVARITSQRLSMEAALKYEYDKLKFRANHQFVTDKYIDLANALNCGITNIETILVYNIGEFVRTNEFPDILTYNTVYKLQEFIKFYNVIGTKEQMDFLKEIYEKANGSVTKKKFFRGMSLYEQDDSQKNKLYELVKEGKINVLLYAYCWNKELFKIDKLKIKDKEFLRFIKAVELIKTINVEQIK